VQTTRLKKKVSITIIALTVLAFHITNVYAHTINVPSNAYFGLPDNGTYINFNPAVTLDTAYRQNNYWYFNSYGFQVENANMTITDYFTNPNYLYLTITAATGNTSTTKIYVATKDKPTTIEINNQIYYEGDNWTFDRTNMILTLTWLHSSDADAIFDWTPIQSGSPSGGPPSPSPEEVTPFIPPFVPPPEYAINFGYTGIFLLVVGSILLISMFAKARKPKTIQGLWKQKVSTNKKHRLSPWTPIIIYILFILVWFLMLRRLFLG